jgi:redox-sensitive bicupin YhaK (pirin superfamily)
VHFLQIWIEPAERGIDPGYEEKRFDAASKRGRLCLIASADGAEGSVRIHQDARLYAGLLDGAEAVAFEQREGRRTYVHVIRGSLDVDGQRLSAGDALKSTGQATFRLSGGQNAEVLVFDLP